MTTISFVSVTDSGQWTAQVKTSFSDNTRDECILRNGFVTLREGMNLYSPPGFTLDEWSSVSVSPDGTFGMAMKIRMGSSTQDGAFRNLVPIALVGDLIEIPPFGPGSKWDKIEHIKLNSNNTMLVMGTVANTSVAGAREDSLVRYQLDDSGNVLGADVLGTKQMFIDAMGTSIQGLGNSDHQIDLNENGDFIVFVQGLGPNAVLINMDTVVAQDLLPGPIPGTTWKTLNLARLTINDHGDYALTGNVDDNGTNLYVTDKGGEKFVAEGDILPELSPAGLGKGTQAPIILANNGDLFWYARVSVAADDAFMRNKTPIVQQGRDTVENNLIETVSADENSFSVSRNGRFFVGRVSIQQIGNSAIFMDFGLAMEIPGCFGNPGKLSLASGECRLGQELTLALDNGQVPGALPFLLLSTERIRPLSSCGVMTQFGEVLISPVHARVKALPPWDGVNPATFTFRIPIDISLLNVEFYAQGAFQDLAVPSPEKFRLTNGMRFEVGAP